MIPSRNPPARLDEQWIERPRSFRWTTALGVLALYAGLYLISQQTDRLGRLLLGGLLVTLTWQRHLWETYASLPATELLLRYRWSRRFLARCYLIDLAARTAVHGAGLTALWFAGIIGESAGPPAWQSSPWLPPLVCLGGSALMHAIVGLHRNLRTWTRIPARHRSSTWPYQWALVLTWIATFALFIVLVETAPLLALLLPALLGGALAAILPEVESPRSIGQERPVRGPALVRSHPHSPWRALLWNGLTREGRLLAWSLVACTLVTTGLALAGSLYCLVSILVGVAALLAACFWTRRWFIWDPWRSASFLDGHGLALGRMLRILLMAHLAGALVLGGAIVVLVVLAPASVWLGLVLLWLGVAPALAWHSVSDGRVWLGVAATVALGWWSHGVDSTALAMTLEGLGLVTWITGLVWCVVTVWRTRDERALRHQLLGP